MAPSQLQIYLCLFRALTFGKCPNTLPACSTCPSPRVCTVQKPVDYLTGEDVTLYNGLGPVYFQPKTISMSALAHFQLGLLLLHGKVSGTVRCSLPP